MRLDFRLPSDSASHGMGTGSVDFFISYTSRDWSWASWLDFLLREQGYSTLVQGYDFDIGKSFVRDMRQALKQCRFVACLSSPAYLESGWCQKELEAGLHADNLVLLRIAECKLDGLLVPYAYADLFDLDADEARELALAQLHKCQGHDPRPKVGPLFPGKLVALHAPRFPALLPNIWNIQQQRNPYFTGREEILLNLHESLQAGETAALTQAIQGLGGAWAGSANHSSRSSMRTVTQAITRVCGGCGQKIQSPWRKTTPGSRRTWVSNPRQTNAKWSAKSGSSSRTQSACCSCSTMPRNRAPSRTWCRLADAQPLYRRALEIHEQSYGLNHPNVAAHLNNLAELLRETNRLADAEPLYRHALGIFEASLGLEHPHTVLCRAHLESLRQQASRRE